ncbi:MAG: RlmE family RNA methyltransferase [Syntrophorhabdaceae bacterium]|nr:RlmE family RNA methyltransferase [Syntrophorhabdaceae bacterium]
MGRFVVKDAYFKRAKSDGFRARSAYKLKEIVEKYPIIKKGDKVLDIGCAPGSFIQVISSIVGERGLVVGIDILPVKPFPSCNVKLITHDIRDIDIKVLLLEHSIEYFDVITSDISPNLSGIREVDNRNFYDLFLSVVNIIKDGLKEGGFALIKAFYSESLKDMENELKSLFKGVRLFKPSASRSVSSEIYFVCMYKK